MPKVRSRFPKGHMMTEGSTIRWAILLTQARLFLETVVDRRADVGVELFQICSIGKWL